MLVRATRRYLQRLASFGRNARLFLLSTVITGLGYSIYMLIFNLFVDSQGYSRSFLGELQSMPNLIALLSALPAGVLVDRIGRKRAMNLANAGRLVAYLGIVFSPGPWSLRLSMVVFGVAQSLWMVSAAPFMMENSKEEERNALFSANFGLQTLVGFFGTLLGGYLPTIFGNALGAGVESPEAYAATLSTTVLLGVLAVVPVLMIEEEARPAGAGARVRSFLPWRNLASPRLAARIFLPNIIISMGAAILIPYMNLFFKETYAISDKLLGTLFAVSSVVTGVTTLASPLLADRWGRIRALVFTQLTSIPFLLLIGFSGIFWLSGLAFWVRAALMNMGNPLYSAFAMEQVAEGERATVSGLMGMSWNIGWTIGPFVSGFMQSHPDIGFQPIFVITCTLYIVASVLEKRFFQRTDDRARRAALLKQQGVVDLSQGAHQ
ncbi:MAG TPA: MFS transporter [Anaerolineae bacterium]|nr:MFS transporter [Anaerolineae bacterium]